MPAITHKNQKKPRVGVHLDTSNKGNNNQGCHVYIRIRLEGKYSYYSTEIFVHPKHWDKKGKSFKHVKGHAHSRDKEMQLQHMLLKMNNCVNKLYNSGKAISEKVLRGAWMHDENDRLVDYCQHILDKEAHSLAPASIRVYDALISRIQSFSPNLVIGQVDSLWLEEFQEFLLREGAYRRDEKGMKQGISPRSMKTYLSVLKKILRKAQKQSLIPVSPFEDYEKKYKIKPSQIEFLSTQEITFLYNAYLDKELLKPRQNPNGRALSLKSREGLHNVLQLYLISLFTGLRYSDVCRIDNCIQGNHIYLTMQKTSNPIRIRVGQRLWKVLNIAPSHPSYLNAPPKPNSYTNVRLRQIWNILGFKKQPTFHSARHTFATTLLAQGTDLKTVSRLLGHSSVAMTEIYTHISDAQKDEAILKMDQLEEGHGWESDPVGNILTILRANPQLPQPPKEWLEALQGRNGGMRIVG